MVLQLTEGVAMLLALCFLHGANMRALKNWPWLGQIFSGLLFGSVCVLGMLNPVTLAPGVFFDARSVILSMAGLFGGPLVAALSTLIAMAWRLWAGGTGALVGVMVIMLSTLLGLGYRMARARGRLDVQPLTLMAFGLVLHLGVLGLFQWLAPDMVQHINATLALPLLLVFIPATALLGILLRDVENRQATERALIDSSARLRAIATALPDVLLVIDAQGRYIDVLSSNDAPLLIPASQLLGKLVHELLPAAQADRFLALIRKTLRSGQTETFSYQMHTLSGQRHFEGRARPLGTVVNGQATVVFLARDITERLAAESALRESELRFRSLLRDIPSISVQGYLADGTTTYWNKASENLYGYTEQEALGQNLVDLIVPAEMHEPVRRDIAAIFTAGIPIPPGELRLRHKDGTPVEVFSSHARIDVPGQAPELFCIDIDISGRKAAEEEARYLAFYDALTRLPNRRLLVDRLQQVMASSARTGLNAAVLFLDLDNFKTLNDSRGHDVGDLLLIEVAGRLRSAVREQDTVARLGGDEFVLVLQNLDAEATEAAAQVRTVSEQVLTRLRLPYLLQGHEHHMTASIGATLLRQPHASVDEVLKQADLAMYRAKNAGRNTLRFFDPDMQEAVNQRALLETEMHTGLRLEQFLLLYQPQVDGNGCVTGAEVLVRWVHPVKGMVSPGVFIPLAEETGLILPLGHWVLETTLRQQARWREDARFAHLNLAINVSARQFRQDDFVPQLLQLLAQTGANPARIKLELTETLLLEDVDSVIATMLALKQHGLGFSLDDFGTGYSSLSYLKRLPLDQIKIDQGFVRDVLHDPKDAAIAHAIIALAGRLGLAVIAEGVETAEHHRFLQEHGCPAFQGYFFGRPEPLEAFEQRVLAGSIGRSAQVLPQPD